MNRLVRRRLGKSFDRSRTDVCPFAFRCHAPLIGLGPKRQEMSQCEIPQRNVQPKVILRNQILFSERAKALCRPLIRCQPSASSGRRRKASGRYGAVTKIPTKITSVLDCEFWWGDGMATSILGAFSLLSFFIFWAYPTSAYEYGAPCAAQYSMHPSSIYHGESRNLKQSPPPFRFFIAEFDDLDIHTYVPNRTYTSKASYFRSFDSRAVPWSRPYVRFVCAEEG